MPSYQDLQTWGDWLAKNPDQAGTQDYQDIAGAYTKLKGDMDQQQAQNLSYDGVGGAVKAAGAGLAHGLVELPGLLSRYTPMAMIDRALHGDKAFDAGDSLKKDLNIPEAQDIPSPARKYFYGGDFVGGSVMPVAGELGLARSLVKSGMAAGPGLFRQAMTWTGENPGAALKASMAAASGGATGTAISDTIAPDSTGAHLVGGLVGSVLSPAAGVSRLMGMGQGASARVRGAFDPEYAAAQNLGQNINQNAARTGQTIQDVLSDLQANAAGPATARTTNQAVHDTASALAAKDVGFSRDLAGAEQGALGGYGGEITQGIGGTTGQDLVGAAKGEVGRRAGLVQQNIDATGAAARGATQDAQTAADALRVPYPDQVAASNAVAGLVTDARTAGRAGVQQAWDAVPKEMPIGTGFGSASRGARLVRSIEKMAASDPSFSISPAAQQKLSNITSTLAAKNPLQPVTVGDVMALKSQLRADARKFGGNAANTDAIQIARSSSALGDHIDRTLANTGIPGWDAANAATRAYHDRFTRTFAGQLVRRDPSGALKINPDLAGQRILSGTPEQQALQMGHVVQATDNPALAQRLLETEQRYQVGKELGASPVAGPVQANKLVTEQAVYGAMPNLRNDVQTALDTAQQAKSAGQTASMATERGTGYVQNLQTKGPYGELLQNAERPQNVIGDILKPGNGKPLAQLDALHRATAKLPGGADGLKATLNDFVMGQGSAIDAAHQLIRPITGKGPSLADWMKSKGLLNTTEHAQVTRAARRVLELNEAVLGRNPRALELSPHVPELADALARSIGSSAASRMAHGLGVDRTLIWNAQGARLGHNIFVGKLGGQTQQQVLQDALLGRNGRSIEALLAKHGQALPGAGGPAVPPRPQPTWFNPAVQQSAGRQYEGQKRRRVLD